MTHYWNTCLDHEFALGKLGAETFRVYDITSLQLGTHDMWKNYPDYIERRYPVYSFGSCIGYLTDTFVQQLLQAGTVLIRDKCIEANL